MKAQFLNLILDFFQGFASEVTDANELVFRLVDDILYRVDAGPSEAIVGTDGEVQIVNGHLEHGRFRSFLIGFATFFAPLDFGNIGGLEEGQVVDQDFSSTRHGFIRSQAAVGPNFQGQAVIVGDVADTSVGDAKLDARDRRIDGVDRNESNGLILGFVLIS